MSDGRATDGRWIGAAIRLALLGATLGVALDWVHVATGTTAYTSPAVLGLAWWVPLLFGGAAVAMGLARPLAEIVRGVTDPAIKKDLYVLAFAIVRADENVSGAERIYLAQLAHQLGLDPAAVQAIENETASKIDSLSEN